MYGQYAAAGMYPAAGQEQGTAGTAAAIPPEGTAQYPAAADQDPLGGGGVGVRGDGTDYSRVGPPDFSVSLLIQFLFPSPNHHPTKNTHKTTKQGKNTLLNMQTCKHERHANMRDMRDTQT